jgi:hypothetical protein
MTAAQRAFLNSTAKEVLFSGGRGCGKTWALREVLRTADPRKTIIFGMYRSNVDYLLEGHPRRWGFRTVSASSACVLRGLAPITPLNIVVDEAEMIAPRVLDSIEEARSRCDGRVLYASLTYGIGANWLRRRFITEGGKSREHIHSARHHPAFDSDPYVVGLKKIWEQEELLMNWGAA